MTTSNIVTQSSDLDDDKKQSKSFSLTKGLLRRLQDLMDRNNIPATEQNDLTEFLLNAALEEVEKGSLVLPLQHIAVLKKPR